jgi:hypothetical protein
VVSYVEADLRKKAEDVVEKARSLCVANSVTATTNSSDCIPRSTEKIDISSITHWML